jgi:hypothetical protein
MKTIRKKAVKLNIPADVLQKDFSKPADGAQRMVFFYRSLYDAIKLLLCNARFKGRQFLYVYIYICTGNVHIYVLYIPETYIYLYIQETYIYVRICTCPVCI